MSQVATRPTGAIGRMSAVAAAHVALVFVIANGFGLMPKAQTLPPDVNLVDVAQPERPIEPLPHIQDPPLVENTVYVAPPENPPVETEDPEKVIVAKVTPPGEILGEGGSADVMPIVASHVDPKHPLTRPAYPIEAIRGEIEGAVVVEVYVQANGHIGDARIVTSSGYDFFDRATLEEARRNWRMLPATRNGEPFAQWYRTRVVFKLTQR